MSTTASLAIGLLEVIGVVFGLLFIVMQLLLRQGNASIRPEVLIFVFETILIGMLFLVVAAAGITWVFIHEVDPNLILPAGLLTLVLVLILFSSALVTRALIREQLFVETDDDSLRQEDRHNID